MENLTIITLISLCASISSIIFSLLNHKRQTSLDHKAAGKSEGLILFDIGYIKACIERVEKNISKVEDTYHLLDIRLTKTEIEKMFKRIV